MGKSYISEESKGGESQKSGYTKLPSAVRAAVTRVFNEAKNAGQKTGIVSLRSSLKAAIGNAPYNEYYQKIVDLVANLRNEKVNNNMEINQDNDDKSEAMSEGEQINTNGEENDLKIPLDYDMLEDICKDDYDLVLNPDTDNMALKQIYNQRNDEDKLLNFDQVKAMKDIRVFNQNLPEAKKLIHSQKHFLKSVGDLTNNMIMAHKGLKVDVNTLLVGSKEQANQIEKMRAIQDLININTIKLQNSQRAIYGNQTKLNQEQKLWDQQDEYIIAQLNEMKQQIKELQATPNLQIDEISKISALGQQQADQTQKLEKNLRGAIEFQNSFVTQVTNSFAMIDGKITEKQVSIDVLDKKIQDVIIDQNAIRQLVSSNQNVVSEQTSNIDKLLGGLDLCKKSISSLIENQKEFDAVLKNYKQPPIETPKKQNFKLQVQPEVFEQTQSSTDQKKNLLFNFTEVSRFTD